MSSLFSCPLCLHPRSELAFVNVKRTFYRCAICDLLFIDPSERLSESEERNRYESHNNDVRDPRYQTFLSPLVEIICERVPRGRKGLDYGAGPGPALAEMLKKENYDVSIFDPFFWPNKETLHSQYDFIVSSETVEHFYEPRREFHRLRSLLNPAGALFIMTLLHSEKMDLSQWYYLKDPTHVCAFSEKTFFWIKKEFRFRSLETKGPRIISLFL